MTESSSFRAGRRGLLRLMALLPLGLPAACAGLARRGSADHRVFSLSSVQASAGPPVTWQLVVDAPEAASLLDRARIALQRPDGGFDYFGDANWSDRPSAMVQQQLLQSFFDTGRIVGLARDSLSLRADYLLRSELRDFQAVYSRLGEAPEVRVTLSVQLVRMPERIAVGGRLFEARARAAEDSLAAVAQAFEAAFAEVQRALVDWVLSAGEGDYRTRV